MKSKRLLKPKAKPAVKRLSKPKPTKTIQAKPKLSSELIGILGGSFNPVHIGHINSALTVRRVLDLEKVFLIPCFNSPHKEVAGPSAEDRLEMVKRSIPPHDDELDWDDLEIRREGTTYTVDTLREYNKRYKPDNIYFIMGADAFMEFPRWHQFEEVIKLANFVVTTRPEVPLSLAAVDLPAGLQSFVKASDKNCVILSTGRKIRRIDLDDLDISATDLRKKLRSGHTTLETLPPAVLSYINEKGLYRRTSPLVEDYRSFSIFCAEKILAKKALGLKIYDMVARNSYGDYSIVCSSTSTKHAVSLAQTLLQAVKEEFGLHPISLEGVREGQWVLIDFGAVLIHIFEDSVRNRYRLDELLSDCPQFQNEIKELRSPPPLTPPVLAPR